MFLCTFIQKSDIFFKPEEDRCDKVYKKKMKEG